MRANEPSRPVGAWRSGWRRLRRDRRSFLSLLVVCAIVLLGVFGGAAVSQLVGHDGDTPFAFASSTNNRAVGPWTHVPAPAQTRLGEFGNLLPPPRGTKTTLFVLGSDGPLGRDELIRLLDGLRTSLEIAIGALLVALAISVPLGTLAGYFGGFVDAAVSQLTETIMAFPLLLFLLFANRYLIGDLRSVGWGSYVPEGAPAEAVLIGAFTAFYPTRLIRSHLFVLRNAEFVEAAHMVGASTWRILRQHLLPHLAPTLLVWGAVAIGTNILAEVGLSFLGVGVQVSTPTLGSQLSTVWGTIYNPQAYDGRLYTPWQTVFPMVTIVVTVVSLNRLSEAVRRALEPRVLR